MRKMKLAVIMLLFLCSGVLASELESCPQNLRLLSGGEPVLPRVEAHKIKKGWVSIKGLLGRDENPFNLSVVASSPKGVYDKIAIEAVKSMRYEWSGETCLFETKFRIELE